MCPPGSSRCPGRALGDRITHLLLTSRDTMAVVWNDSVMKSDNSPGRSQTLFSSPAWWAQNLKNRIIVTLWINMTKKGLIKPDAVDTCRRITERIGIAVMIPFEWSRHQPAALACPQTWHSVEQQAEQCSAATVQSWLLLGFRRNTVSFVWFYRLWEDALHKTLQNSIWIATFRNITNLQKTKKLQIYRNTCF